MPNPLVAFLFRFSLKVTLGADYPLPVKTSGDRIVGGLFPREDGQACGAADVPQAVAMGVQRSTVRIIAADANGWDIQIGVASRLGWDIDRFAIQPPAAPKP